MSLLARFLLRWAVSSLGLWVAASLLSGYINYSGNPGVIISAGFLLAAINTLVRPILVLFSLPAILLTLGLFMLIINGLTVWLVSALYPPLQIASFWAAIFAGIIVGLVNYLVTAIVEERHERI